VMEVSTYLLFNGSTINLVVPGKMTYILEQYKGVTTEIKNLKGYVQTVIYNSIIE